MSSIIEDVGEPAGISYTWAHEIDAALASLGLIRIHTERHAESVAGGSAGCNLMANYVRQAADRLLKCGISNSKLERFDQMMLEPESSELGCSSLRRSMRRNRRHPTFRKRLDPHAEPSRSSLQSSRCCVVAFAPHRGDATVEFAPTSARSRSGRRRCRLRRRADRG